MTDEYSEFPAGVKRDSRFPDPAAFADKAAMMRRYPERIKQAREGAKLTQKQLGDVIGVSQTTIAGYERGAAEPNLDTFEKIAHATGCPLGWLILGVEEPAPDDGPPTAADSTEFLRRNLMLKLIALIERRLSRETIRLTPEAKARVVVAVHDIVTALGDETKIEEELERYIRRNRG